MIFFIKVQECVFIFVLSAQAIGTRLSELCHSDSESPANILGYIFDEETKRRMKKEDEEEDYLDDSEFSLQKKLQYIQLDMKTWLKANKLKFVLFPTVRIDSEWCSLRWWVSSF